MTTPLMVNRYSAFNNDPYIQAASPRSIITTLDFTFSVHSEVQRYIEQLELEVVSAERELRLWVVLASASGRQVDQTAALHTVGLLTAKVSGQLQAKRNAIEAVTRPLNDARQKFLTAHGQLSPTTFRRIGEFSHQLLVLRG
jgi:hypothetical protein